MKLSKWAKKQGVSYVTAYRWFSRGQIPGAKQMPSGTIIIDEYENKNIGQDDKVVIYCRVSSHNKKDDLERQVERCTQFCYNKGWVIERVVKEVASGMNDKRKKLSELLKSQPAHLVVEHKDRLTRFGFHYLELLLPKLTVINRDHEEQQDLMKDMVAIVTSFCCRLYGLRKGNKKASKIKKELSDQSH